MPGPSGSGETQSTKISSFSGVSHCDGGIEFGKLLQLWGMIVLLLEVIGEPRLARFGKWSVATAFPQAVRIYKKFLLLWIPIILPIAKLYDRVAKISRSFRSLFLLSLMLTILIVVTFIAVSSIYGRVYADVVIKNLLFIIFELPFRVFVPIAKFLILFALLVQAVTFIPAIFIIVLARLLSHRYIGVTLKVISALLYMVGFHFDILVK